MSAIEDAVCIWEASTLQGWQFCALFLLSSGKMKGLPLHELELELALYEYGADSPHSDP